MFAIVDRALRLLCGLVAATSLLAVDANAASCAAPSDAEIAHDLALFADGVMASAMHTRAVPGAVLSVVQDGRLVFARGYGFADLDRGTKVDAAETLFRIGSVSKLFTYTAIQQLAEQGKLRLGDDVNRSLRGVRIRDAFNRPVTFDDLMAHRAGFEDGAYGYDFFRDPAKLPSLQDFVAQHQLQRVRPPGAVTVYSNYGAAVLGLVVEQLSGLPYEAYVQRNILDPLGMTQTSIREAIGTDEPAPFGRMDPALAAHLSNGYRRVAGRDVPAATERIFPAAAPAGSFAATAVDMACFMRAYLVPSPILSRATILAMRERAFTDRAAGTDFARGFFATRIAGHPAFQHTGALGPFKSNLVLIPALRLGVFVAVNGAGGGPLVLDVPRLLVAHLAPQPDRALPSPPTDFATRASRFEGTYLTERRSYTKLEKFLQLGVGEARVTSDGHGRLIVATRNETRSWVEIAPLTFGAADGSEDTLLFEQDGDGRIVRFYPPLGHEPFARLPWWQRAASVEASRIAVAVLAVTLLLRAQMVRAQHGSPTVAGARVVSYATALVSLAVLLLWHRAEIELAANAATLAQQWPPAALRHLVIGGWVLATMTCASFFCLSPLWRSSAVGWSERLHRTLFSAMLLLLCAQLFVWNLFAPATN